VTRGSGVGGAARDVLAVLGTFLLIGVACGVLWWLAVTPATFTAMPDGGGSMSEVQLGKRFDADGWYAVIGLVVGFLSGLGVTWWRSRDFRLTTFLLVPGSAVAAGAMALTGSLLGPPDPHAALATASPGQLVPVQLEVSGFAPYLVWPVAVLLGSLMVLFSTPAPPAREEYFAGDGSTVMPSGPGSPPAPPAPGAPRPPSSQPQPSDPSGT
jgi:hypothetical protein